MSKPMSILARMAALAAGATLVGSANAAPRDPITAADAFPPHEVLAAVRTMGLAPVGEPVQRGPYYVLHAQDAQGTIVRVVADAEFGDILSVKAVRPLSSVAAEPFYRRGPRIIHVPQPGEVEEAGPEAEEFEPAAAPAPAPRVRATPQKPPAAKRQSQAVPPRRKAAAVTASAKPPAKGTVKKAGAKLPPRGPETRRAVLSAPPFPEVMPERSASRPQTQADVAVEKFAPPPRAITATSPPPGYVPPAALPASDPDPESGEMRLPPAAE